MEAIEMKDNMPMPKTQEEYDALCDAFLAWKGFPVDNDHRQYFSAFFQHLPSDATDVDTWRLEVLMRKQIANGYAYNALLKMR